MSGAASFDLPPCRVLSILLPLRPPLSRPPLPPPRPRPLPFPRLEFEFELSRGVPKGVLLDAPRPPRRWRERPDDGWRVGASMSQGASFPRKGCGSERGNNTCHSTTPFCTVDSYSSTRQTMGPLKQTATACRRAAARRYARSIGSDDATSGRAIAMRLRGTPTTATRRAVVPKISDQDRRAPVAGVNTGDYVAHAYISKLYLAHPATNDWASLLSSMMLHRAQSSSVIFSSDRTHPEEPPVHAAAQAV